MIKTAKRLMPLAALFALVLSTQYLAQPFVWRHWPVDIVLFGWLDILRDRLLVAACLVVPIAWAVHCGAARRIGKLVMVLAIIVGASAGQGLLALLDTPGAPSTWAMAIERILRWSVFSCGLYAIWLVWSRARDAEVAAGNVLQAEAAADRQRNALRLQALHAQLEPHFLFNTLATVRRLGSIDPACGRELLANLRTFIQLSEKAHPQALLWSLAEEVELIRAYLGVVALRMQGRLTAEFSVSPTLHSCAVPPLAMATLVENAVKHGISPLSGPAQIAVRASCEGGALRLVVSDTGVGFQTSSGSGIGLANTRARLHSLYGVSASLELRANRPSGVTATLCLPASPK